MTVINKRTQSDAIVDVSHALDALLRSYLFRKRHFAAVGVQSQIVAATKSILHNSWPAQKRRHFDQTNSFSIAEGLTRTDVCITARNYIVGGARRGAASAQHSCTITVSLGSSVGHCSGPPSHHPLSWSILGPASIIPPPPPTPSSVLQGRRKTYARPWIIIIDLVIMARP
ncbi:hypothetical protein J6590_020220 [Homalodisca vitripennis]|nr:hypothetical protein J6590_020220 [Homalodisca vitripennis]